jgi:hypothetical protein
MGSRSDIRAVWPAYGVSHGDRARALVVAAVNQKPGGACLTHFHKIEFLFVRHGSSKRSGVGNPLQLAGLCPEPLRSIRLCSK